MERYKEGKIEWLEFSLLSDFKNLKHAVFLRQGGNSPSPFNSLNLGHFTEDDPSNVIHNFEKVKKIFKKQDPLLKPFVLAKQVHEETIVKVDGSLKVIPTADGLMTNSPSLPLVICHADCQSLILFDPCLSVVANIHCGWRGLVKGIYKKALGALKKEYGCKPENLLACIGPSLGPEEAEFIHYREEFPEEFWQFQTRPYFFDLWTIAEEQLLEAGILSHHLEIARLSTYANPHDYFSYRREKTTGRNATVVFVLA